MSRPLLTPLGTARAAIGAPPLGELPSFPEDLARLTRAADLGEHHLHRVWELARFVPRLDADSWRGLLVLLLLLVDAIAHGSTRLRIDQAARQSLRERAMMLGLGRDDLRRAEAMADAILGHAGRVPHPPMASQLSLALEASGDDTGPERSNLRVLIGPPGSRRPLILEGGALAPQRFVALEERLARRLRDRIAPPYSDAALERAIEVLRAQPTRGPRGPIVLTDEQEDAVRAAIRGPITLVSGGPGTGKTSIVVSILRALVRIEPDVAVALAAPTGKAADRLEQSVRRALAWGEDSVDVSLAAALPRAATLHRLLAWSPSEERFRYGEASPLAERMVIVDEASMIDLALMERLFAALQPDARLVLLGDADQLPSVDPGAVFADLVATGAVPTITTVRLTRSHRIDPRGDAGSHILGIAALVRQGIVPALASQPGPLEVGTIARMLRPSSDGSEHEGVALLEARDAALREAFLAWWWEHRVRGPAAIRELSMRTFDPRSASDAPLLERLFDHFEASRLLCVTRGRATGAEAINAWMGARTARDRGVSSLGLLSIGEPVIVVRNDYERGLFNGDQGLVLWVREPTSGAARPAVVVRRDERFLAYSLDAVRAIVERAYAITVHKAQGSEHDSVALVLPEEDVGRLLTREIVYTAMTRARRSVLLVGSRDILAKAIRRASVRETGLPERLRGGA
jgi:exodeoxyribonuclease V alpha subunit